MRKLLLLSIALIIAFALVIPSCNPNTQLTEEQKLELIKDIKTFEKKLGFKETENFITYSDEIEGYDYFFYTPNTALPYSLDDSLLQCSMGRPENFDLEGYDVFFYSIQAIAEVKTPVTKSLLRAPLSRFTHIIFHEDWHEQMVLPLGIEEPCAEVVSYVAAMLFSEEKFGKDSAVYKTLNDEFCNKLKESKLYQQYYDELNVLYSRLQSGKISEADTLSRKAELLESMGNDLEYIWGGKPRQLNNAFIAFQMTYLRHLPLMHEVFAATDFDLTETISIFRSMPEQGTKFDNLAKVKSIEKQVVDYLCDSLQEIR